MSLALLLICRRSIRPSSLLRSLNFSQTVFIAESSTFKSKYGSLKPSTSVFESPFRESTDEKSRRLKLQENIRFREKFQLEQDYELIYAMPKQRLYGLMHLLCTCATVTVFTFVVIHFHREMLDIEPLINNSNQNISPIILYSIAAIIGSTFALTLALISRMPIRLYYSPVRLSYALFYHPTIGIIPKRKILYRNDQYQVIPQKLDSIESEQRSIKIRLNVGDGLFNLKKSFYLVEVLFRSQRDIHRIKMANREDDETQNNEKRKENVSIDDETNIWQTVVEKKDQCNDKQKPSQRRTFI